MSDDATPTAEAPAAESTAEAPAAEATTEGTDAAPAYELPEGYAEMTDAELEEMFNTLDADVEAVKAMSADPASLTFAVVAEGKAKRLAQGTITELLATRQTERAQLVADLGALDTDKPVLPVADEADEAPVAKAASAQPSPAEKASVIEAIRDREAAPQPKAEVAQPSILASVESSMPRWISTREVGEKADWGVLVNSTRPVGGGANGIEPRPHESVLAAARTENRNFEFELTDSATYNDRIINEAMQAHRDRRMSEGHDSKSAAICDPATILRDAMVCGTDATPFQASLTQMGAQSGNALKFQYRQPTSITEAQAGIGQWTTTEQGTISPTDPTTWKPCVAIACPGYATEIATEITACYTVDAFTELSSPESIADFVYAKDRAFARFTEAWHLRKTDTFLYNLSFNGYTGAVPDTIEAILNAISAGNYGERLDPGKYVVYGSPGVLAALAIDQNRKAFSNGAAAMDAVRQVVEDATGTSYVQLLDQPLQSNNALGTSPFGSLGSIGAGSATALPKLSSVAFTLRIIDPSSFVAFNTGEAVFGEQITLDQARQNQRGFFQRIFGGMMKPGCTPGYKVAVTLCTDGSRGGFVEPGCTPTGFTSAGVPFVATPAG